MSVTRSLRAVFVVAGLLALVVALREDGGQQADRLPDRQEEAAQRAQPPRRPARAGLSVVKPQQAMRQAGLTKPPGGALDQAVDEEYDERDDISEPTLVEVDDDEQRTTSLERAKSGLELLTQQSSDNFLKLFSMLESSGQYEARPVARARDATRTYLQHRTELLERSFRSFIESDGKVIDAALLAELRTLESDFHEQMQELEPSVPAVGELATMIASTSHPLPFFANSDAPEPPSAN